MGLPTLFLASATQIHPRLYQPRSERDRGAVGGRPARQMRRRSKNQATDLRQAATFRLTFTSTLTRNVPFMGEASGSRRRDPCGKRLTSLVTDRPPFEGLSAQRRRSRPLSLTLCSLPASSRTNSRRRVGETRHRMPLGGRLIDDKPMPVPASDRRSCMTLGHESNPLHMQGIKDGSA